MKRPKLTLEQEDLPPEIKELIAKERARRADERALLQKNRIKELQLLEEEQERERIRLEKLSKIETDSIAQQD